MTVSVVTGSNTGLGLAIAEGLARAGHEVVLAVRNTAKGDAAASGIRSAVPGAEVSVMPVDLASLASIRSFAAAVADRHPQIDVLVNNAGLVQKSRTTTADGFESTFGVNHLGHFLLTNLLHGPLVAAPRARVVVVASDAHRFARKGIPFDDLQAERKYGPMAVYSVSKLANILFARSLSKRWNEDGIMVNSFHPGFVASRFGRDGDGGKLGEIAMTLGKPFAKSPEKAAKTGLHMALSPELANVTGEYFVNSKIRKPSAKALDDAVAERLWDVSSTLVGLG